MDWNKLRSGIYHVDGSWRDVYVLNATRDDWQRWIAHVNTTYKVSFIAENYEAGEATDKINAGFIDDRWDEEHYTACASVFLNEVQVNCHFFMDNEIENDIDPKQVKSLDDHLMIMSYMKAISTLLGKEVILTKENCEDAIWIRVNGDAIQFVEQSTT